MIRYNHRERSPLLINVFLDIYGKLSVAMTSSSIVTLKICSGFFTRSKLTKFKKLKFNNHMKYVMDNSSLKVYETQKQTSSLRRMSTLMV